MAGLAVGRLYERDAELRMAADLLSRAADGRGGALFYAGDAGLGKTALVKHVIGNAAGDFRLGQAAGDPAETSLAFSFLGQATDALGCPVPLAEADTGRPSVRDVRSLRFHQVLRWLREVNEASEASEASEVGEPVLLVLDDLQWADSDSLAMLSFLCRRLDGLAVAVIGTLRAWPPSAYDVARRLWAAGRAGFAELAPLTDPAAERVVMARVRGQASAATISRAVTLCAGNPLLLEQVSGLICAGNDLTSPQLSRQPQNPRPLLLSRFAGLRAEALRCVRAASVLGTTFQPSLAAKLARVPEKTIERTLDALARSGLAREVPGHLMEFVHPLFSQLLYEDLGAALRDQLHHRACQLLLDQGLDREAAWHAMRGHVTGDPAALAALERAGLDGLRHGAVEAATEYLRAAVTQAGQRASRAALTGLCEALLAGGRFREAIAHCERLVARPAESPAELARALMIRATGLAQAGRLDEACLSLEETVAVAKDTDVPLAGAAQTQHGYYRWWLSGPAAALPILAQARELAGPNGTRATALWGFVAVAAGDPSGLDAIAAASRAVLATPRAHLSDFATTWGALASFAVSATLTERFTDAEQACTAALEAAEQAGAGRAAGSLGLSVVYAELLLRLGRLPEALCLTTAVLELRDAMPALAVTASVIHAEILLHLGRLDEARQWLAHAEAAPAAEASWEPALRLRRITGQLALRAGEWHTASTRLREAEELSTQAGIGEPCLSMWARPAVVAYLRAGRAADAERVLGWLDRCAARLPCRWPRIAALSARAGLAELAGDIEAAEAAFTEALRLHSGLPLPLERIETLLEYGSFLRRAGASARARPLLGEAMSAAEAIGADWLARHAHRELTASGGRRRHRETASRLTPRERRVFELAAQGLSNDAIASRLQISPGTVKTHLEHIYTKLGIHSRRELMLRQTEILASLTCLSGE